MNYIFIPRDHYTTVSPSLILRAHLAANALITDLFTFSIATTEFHQ
jgi:hypothetical protein